MKSYTGELHIIPNGTITVVINYSIYNSLALIDVSVAPETDIPTLEKNIQEFLKIYRANMKILLNHQVY